MIQNLLTSENVWHGSTFVPTNPFATHGPSATRHLPPKLQTRSRNFLSTQLNRIARAFVFVACTRDSTVMEMAFQGEMLSGCLVRTPVRWRAWHQIQPGIQVCEQAHKERKLSLKFLLCARMLLPAVPSPVQLMLPWRGVCKTTEVVRPQQYLMTLCRTC